VLNTLNVLSVSKPTAEMRHAKLTVFRGSFQTPCS
jgi:hypothetical protein